MNTTKKRKTEYELYFLTVDSFSTSFQSSVNYKAIEAANKLDIQVPVFKHNPTIVFECSCFYPESMNGTLFYVTLYGEDDENRLMLSDCIVQDHKGRPKRIKRGDKYYPLHKLPNGVGSLEKVRGANNWEAFCFLSSNAVSTMISMMSINKQYYLSIDVVKLNRFRSVKSIDLQTDKPE